MGLATLLMFVFNLLRFVCLLSWLVSFHYNYLDEMAPSAEGEKTHRIPIHAVKICMMVEYKTHENI